MTCFRSPGHWLHRLATKSRLFITVFQSNEELSRLHCFTGELKFIVVPEERTFHKVY